MTLEEKNKKLLELAWKYDKFACDLEHEYFTELNCNENLSTKTKDRIKLETEIELNALTRELREFE